MGLLPLDKRFRRMNLFDVGGCAIEGVEYVEEVLEANINITREREKELYVPVLLSRLRTDGFTEEDRRNSMRIVCKTSLAPGLLNRFLSRFFGAFTLQQTGDAIEVEFSSGKDATECLYLSSKEFVFLRPERYVELPGSGERRFEGSKYCREVPCTQDKILLGPLDVCPSVLRDALDGISPLQSFRECGDPMYFVFTFKDEDFCDLFVRATGSIFILDLGRPLASTKAYEGCSVLEFGRRVPQLAPRRMSGPAAVSKERTRIVVLLNVVGPWDVDTEPVVEMVRKRCLGHGAVGDVMIPRGERGSARQPASSRIFIECKDLSVAEKVYDDFGGLVYEDRIVVAGYYPELNYLAGEYE